MEKKIDLDILEVIRNFYKYGATLDLISKATGLSINKIKKILTYDI